MTDLLADTITIAKDLAVYVAAYYYYHQKNRDLLGGFWGAAIIGTVGAVLIVQLAGINLWFTRFVTWLMQPKWEDNLLFRVNLIAAFIGGFLFVIILSKINHDRERK